MAAPRSDSTTVRAYDVNEVMYRTLFNAIDEGFCLIEMIFDESGRAVDYRFIEVNPSFETHTGLRGAECKTMRELVPEHEDYWFEIFGKVAVTGQSVRFQRRAEKLGRWYSVYAFRVGDAGKRQVAILFTDITEQKRAVEALLASEERLRLIVENAREFAILTMDLDRHLTSWSTGAERVLGYAEAEIIGRKGDLLFTEKDQAAGAPADEAERARIEGRAADERWHVRKSGERFWGSGYMMAMRDSEGSVIGFVKILHDRTEAKRAEEELARSRQKLESALKEAELARQEAEAAGRTKDHFLATLSHELRTPLTPVVMTVESLLKRKDLPPRAVDGLKLIYRNIDVQTHFIDDLLDVTRIAKGKFEIVSVPLDVHEAVRAAVQICEPDFSTRAHELTLLLEARKTQVQGDFPRVQQTFWNLLKNAAKFTPEGGTITVQSWNEGAEIVVAISDTGMGIEPTKLADIFEAFRQGDTSITRRFGGLGLGLAIAKAAVEAMGGRITGESKGAGQGAVFKVRLPVSLDPKAVQ